MLKVFFSFYYYYCLCCIIFNHIRLNFLFNKALTPLFTSIQQSVSTSDHAIGILLTVQIILIIIMGFILSIVYWFFFILMINYTVSFARKMT